MEYAQDIIKRSAIQQGRKVDITQLGALIRENKSFWRVYSIKLRLSNEPVITKYGYKEALTYEGHSRALKWLCSEKLQKNIKHFH